MLNPLNTPAYPYRPAPWIVQAWGGRCRLRDLSGPPRGDVARGGKPAAVRPTRVSGHCPDVGSSAGAPCSVDVRAALAQARAGADERNRHRPSRAGFTAQYMALIFKHPARQPLLWRSRIANNVLAQVKSVFFHRNQPRRKTIFTPPKKTFHQYFNGLSG